MKKVLKAAVKVAAGVKYPTLHFTTRLHTYAKIQMMPDNKRAIKCDLAQIEALTCYKFPPRHVQILAVLITDGRSYFSPASEGRFLLKRAIRKRRRLASRSCDAATLILWNACTGRRGSETAKASPGLLKGELPANCMHMASGKSGTRHSRLQTALMNQPLESQSS